MEYRGARVSGIGAEELLRELCWRWGPRHSAIELGSSRVRQILPLGVGKRAGPGGSDRDELDQAIIRALDTHL